MTQRVVVTGAAGFVGGYLARALAGDGFDVIATVRQSAPAGLPANVRVVAGDLQLPSFLPSRFDALVHCAAETPSRCRDREGLHDRNVAAAGAVFRHAASAGARAIVFMSSMSVYGRIVAPLVTEDLEPRDVDDYGTSKAEGERRLSAAVAAGLPSGLAIRLPGTVGHGSHDNFLSEALAAARAGVPLTGRHPDALFNNIVFAGDLARFVSAWLAAPVPGYHVSNLASREPISISAMYAELFRHLELPQRIQYESTGKPPFLISLERAVSLGYQPATVKESIAAFVRDTLRAQPRTAGEAAPRD